MFVGMLEGMKEESVGFLFNVQVERAPAPAVSAQATPAGLAEFAAAAAQQAGGVATKERPAALRAKGIDDQQQRLTYSGPSEDGGVEVKRTGAPSTAGTTRKERREAARQQQKAGKHSKRG